MRRTGSETALDQHTPQNRPGLAAYLDAWSPVPVIAHDDLSPAPVAALAAVLDQPSPVGEADRTLPPLWHWLHFLEWPAHAEVGEDGHPARGHFLPPVPDRRRMFAGGRAEFRAPLRAGVNAERLSSLAKVEVKQGRTGEMAFVTVRQEISQEGRLCVVDEQDFVYRSGDDERRRTVSTIDPGDAELSEAAWQLALRPEPTLLFRFSALTANAHRIHYDAPYAQGVEGYPALVVHGPLLVLLMLETARREAPERAVRTVSYRLRKPVFAGEHLRALAEPAATADGITSLRVATRRDEQHATAEVTFA
ncbi:MaoC family dehydratase N-terminal domain-containing protein [Streptomyces sp. NBC_00656]|uniref:FAS1-like dehydratase domain-containing protein n=1 Tax=Streptomyces sp. NBC_00656 TaxID=2903668 RepID=UPI00324D4ED4